MRATLLLAFLGCASVHAAQDAAGWLDRPLSGWNRSAAAVPAAPKGSETAAALAARCKLAPVERHATALSRAGWTPFLHQDRALTRGNVDVVAGMTGATAICEPVSFNLFVFVDGRFAGTLSPVPMTANKDGAIGAVRITGADSITAEVARFKPADLDCCPSSRARVTYRIEGRPDSIITPTDIQPLR